MVDFNQALTFSDALQYAPTLDDEGTDRWEGGA
jgi:hypothetical protein